MLPYVLRKCGSPALAKMITGCITRLQKKILLHSSLSYQGRYLNFSAWFMKKKVLFEQKKKDKIMNQIAVFRKIKQR